MTRSKSCLTASLILLVVSLACSRAGSNSSQPIAAASPAATKTTSEAVVKADPQPVAVAAGGSGEAVVRVTIAAGYHINANPPTFSYLKATTLEIAPADGISVASLAYPQALTRKFAFAEKPLAVYEGQTDLKATLKAEKSAAPGKRSISAKLRIQACDEQVCYPPGTLELAIPVTIN